MRYFRRSYYLSGYFLIVFSIAALIAGISVLVINISYYILSIILAVIAIIFFVVGKFLKEAGEVLDDDPEALTKEYEPGKPESVFDARTGMYAMLAFLAEYVDGCGYIENYLKLANINDKAFFMISSRAPKAEAEGYLDYIVKEYELEDNLCFSLKKDAALRIAFAGSSGNFTVEKITCNGDTLMMNITFDKSGKKAELRFLGVVMEEEKIQYAIDHTDNIADCSFTYDTDQNTYLILFCHERMVDFTFERIELSA